MKWIKAQVFHQRFGKKTHKFCHDIFYWNVAVEHLRDISKFALCAYNKFSVFSLRDRDHGFEGDESCPAARIQKLKQDYNLVDICNGETRLITLPACFGYSFNPVSFWCLYDDDGGLRVILAEVHNTFSQRHGYLLHHDDYRIIQPDDILTSQKDFHVSPFYSIKGHYQFTFDIDRKDFKITIDYMRDGAKALETGIVGIQADVNKNDPLKWIIRYSLGTFKVITLIHWHAVFLWLKKIQFHKLPLPPRQNIS